MQIVVNEEDILKFRAAAHTWANARLQLTLDHWRKCNRGSIDFHEPHAERELKFKLMKYEEENPFPKFFPNV